ncbi:threonine/homoserine/homoserine lactone efflux protein [Caldicoprobacter guelmensis]|uniref:LysE family transporter n=1 Tax=Caldicoprobacter guelmensis TaxID=1170224 RepID=UPI001959F369|nr:LysE family transporter [Caldicoprobacter guelmensis]MBM7581742.1 threonine/homoserine/homoserine lactone efflux protein [Caldicoprobacter guelmensis]
MSLWGIFLSALIIGFSGAMMPGPMMGVTIDGSLKKGAVAGPVVVLGHGVLEFILVMVMAFGLKDFFANLKVAGLIGLVGGAFLMWMGFNMVRSAVHNAVPLQDGAKGCLNVQNLALAGAVVSITNPYFIMWWATTGMEMIRQAYVLRFWGVAFFYVGHILSDLIWYSAVSVGISRGKKVLSDRLYRWIIFALGLFLIGFSLYFMYSGVEMLI